MRVEHRWEAIVTLLAASALGGCSGEEVGDSTQSGGTPTGGTDVGVSGAGSERGASNVYPYSSGCGPGPYQIPADGTATTDQAFGERITDGVDGDVDCSVTPSGNGYRVALGLEEGSSSFSATATLEALGDGAYGGTGQVGFYHPDAGNIHSETCTFEVLTSQEIGAGKAWGNFDCTESIKEARSGYYCNFEGSFLVENCN